MSPSLEEVIAAVHSMDKDGLDAVFAAIRSRDDHLREINRQMQAATVQVGDRVKTTGIRPKYIAGLTGTIVRKDDQGRFVIGLDDHCVRQADRYATARGEMIVNPGCVEVLESAAAIDEPVEDAAAQGTIV